MNNQLLTTKFRLYNLQNDFQDFIFNSFNKIIKTITLFLIMFSISGCYSNSYQSIAKESKPWTWWVWMGNSVTKQGITENLKDLQAAGFGGVLIFTVYGENGDEKNYLDYLSPQWMEMLKHTIKEAESLGIGVDMLLGEAWPVAGPNVNLRDAAKKIYIEEIEIKENANIRDYQRPLNSTWISNKWRDKKLLQYLSNDTARKYTPLITLAAYDKNGNYFDITTRVNADGFINWGDIQKTCKVYAIFQCPTLRRQNSAAPGGEGWAIDCFNDTSIVNYMKWFEDAFNQAGIEKGKVRAFLNDSYENYLANWTPDFLSEFLKRRGYDLRPYIRFLADTTSCEIRQRVVTDYCETISDLLHDEFTLNWVNKSHQMGILTHNEAHGSPGNLLDLYALSDMPKTEAFGASGFSIPGLRVDPDYPESSGRPNPLVMKFASSAAHIAGRKLVSSESTTWLAEHFKESLSQIKPEVDILLASGINHIFLSSLTYSPKEKPWPGRLVFSTINYNQQSHFWNELPELTGYISKCQSVLQNSTPANDILLYFPIHEMWMRMSNDNRRNRDDIIYPFQVHNAEVWLSNSNFGKLARSFLNYGYTFDYISDRMIAKLEVIDSTLISGNTSYKAIVLPDIETIPLETLIMLRDLAAKGATIIFEKDIPTDVPGLFDLENRRKLLTSVRKDMLINNSSIKITTQLFDVLSQSGIYSEEMARKGLEFIRKKSGNNICYFITNLSDKFSEDWVHLATEAKTVEIYDPVKDKRGNAAKRKSEIGTDIYLQLHPGQSCILTCANTKMTKSKWEYLKPDETHKYEISGPWLLSPTQSIDGSELPPPATLQNLVSWTSLGDKYETFSGKVIYSNTFEVPEELLPMQKFMLDLGNVRETAKVKINGRDIGLAWCIPFRLMIPKGIIKEKNTIEIEVTNLSFNRIIKLDRDAVQWKNYRHFFNIRYQPFDASDKKPEDSGLLSSVCLIPMSSSGI